MEEIIKERSRKNLTIGELKNLIINQALEDYEAILEYDIEEEHELEYVIDEYKERLKYFDAFIDDLDEQVVEKIFNYLKYNYLLEGEEIDYDIVNDLHIGFRLEYLFRQKHNSMSFKAFVLKALEKAEKELKRRYLIIKKRKRKYNSYF